MVALLDHPCSKCGWRFTGYHICTFNLENPAERKFAQHVEPATLGAKSTFKTPSVVATRTAKFHKLSEERLKRDAEIIRLYGEEKLSMTGVAARLSLSQPTVSRVIKAAAATGKVKLRTLTGGRPRLARV